MTKKKEKPSAEYETKYETKFDETNISHAEENGKTMTLPNGVRVIVMPGKDPVTGDPAFHMWAFTPGSHRHGHYAFLRSKTLDAIAYLRDRWENEGGAQPQDHDPKEMEGR